jgi:hypothetical protein
MAVESDQKIATPRHLAESQGKGAGCDAVGRRGAATLRLWLLADLVQVEYLVVCIDPAGEKVRLSLRQADILASLSSRQNITEEEDSARFVTTAMCKRLY